MTSLIQQTAAGSKDVPGTVLGPEEHKSKQKSQVNRMIVDKDAKEKVFIIGSNERKKAKQEMGIRRWNGTLLLYAIVLV